MRAQFGSAVLIPSDGISTVEEVSTHILVQLIAAHMSEFNLIASPDVCLIVFRHLAECERFAGQYQYTIEERGGVRYYPRRNIIRIGS